MLYVLQHPGMKLQEIKLSRIAVLLAVVLSCGSAVAQKSISAASNETPEHFMKSVLRIANGTRAAEILDMNGKIYSPTLLDAMLGEGCLTANQTCVMDHLLWARICGCRYFPEDVEKKGTPLCGCPARLTFSGLSVVQTNSNNVEVSALLNLEPNQPSKVSWQLMLTSEGWRIDDVTTSDFPSLKAQMSANVSGRR